MKAENNKPGSPIPDAAAALARACENDRLKRESEWLSAKAKAERKKRKRRMEQLWPDPDTLAMLAAQARFSALAGWTTGARFTSPKNRRTPRQNQCRRGGRLDAGNFSRATARQARRKQGGRMSTPTAARSIASLSEKIAAKRAGRIATAPESFRKLLTQSWAGKCSPRAAIKAFCGECQGFDRSAITNCTAYACPLWMFRPYQTQKRGPHTPSVVGEFSGANRGKPHLFEKRP